MVNKSDRYDDAGDVIDDDIEDVAIQFRHAALDVAATRHRAVDAVDHERGHEPKQSSFGVVVEYGDQPEQPDDDTARRERVDAPADSGPMVRRGRERLLRHVTVVAHSGAGSAAPSGTTGHRNRSVPVVRPPSQFSPTGYPSARRIRPGRERGQGRTTQASRTLWVGITLAWGFGRVLVVWGTLGRYGVNPWVYAGIEIATSGPYGVATARVVTSLLDRNRQAAGRWAALGLAMFIAPDLYIVAAGRGMPAYVYVVVSVLVALLGTLALFGVRAKVCKGRVARELVSVESAAGDGF